MKRLKFLVIIVSIALVCTACSKTGKLQGNGGGTIGSILRDANCPLTEDQVKQMKAFSPSGGREAFRAVNDIFNEKQMAVLKETFGTMQGRDGGPGMPRFLFFAVIFENENCPLTLEQIQALKALPNDRGAFRQMRDIFTEKQNELLESMFNR